MAAVTQEPTLASSSEIPVLPLMGIFDIGKAHCDVVLTKDHLSWTLIQPSGKDVKHGTHQKSLNLRDVCAVRIKRLHRDKHSGGYPQGVTLFTRKPKRGSCLLRQGNLTLCATNEQCCQRWTKAIAHIIEGYPERPKRLRIFVDVQCENGNAMHVFYKKVQPLLQLAKVWFDVVESSQSGHAKQVVQTMKYEDLDGIVCIGDDAIVTEVSNGLLLRAQSDAQLSIKPDHTPLAKCCVPLGIIPVGPFNLVAHSSQGASDPVTSTLHIIYGNMRPIDVCTLFQNGQLLRFGFSAMYGFGGDCLRRAEKKKKLLGKRRAEYAVARSIMKLRPYECEVSFLPCSDVDGCIQDRTPCQAGCAKCQTDWNLAILPSNSSSTHKKESASVTNSLRVPQIYCVGDSSIDNSSVSTFSMSDGRQTPAIGQSSDQSSESSEHNEIPRPPSRNSWIEGLDDYIPDELVAKEHIEEHRKTSHCQSVQDRVQGIAVLPDRSNANECNDWRTVEGTFFNVSVMTLPNLCSLCPGGMSPQTHLADGSADLILARTTTKSEFVQHLRRYASIKDQFDLPFMCVRRINAVRISPKGVNQSGDANSLLIQQSTVNLMGGDETSQDAEEIASDNISLSVWNVDMELLPAMSLEMRVHKQLLTVFGAGVAYVDKSPATCGCL